RRHHVSGEMAERGDPAGVIRRHHRKRKGGHHVDDGGAREQNRRERRQLGGDHRRAPDRQRAEDHRVTSIERERVPGEGRNHAHRDDAIDDEQRGVEAKERLEHLGRSKPEEFERNAKRHRPEEAGRHQESHDADRRRPQLMIGGDRLADKALRDELANQYFERREVTRACRGRICVPERRAPQVSQPRGHHAFIATTIPCDRASTFSSTTSAAKTASSDGSCSVARRLTTESWPTMRPSLRITTREHTCSTTSSTCELKTTIFPSAAIARTNALSTRAAVTSSPENGSSRMTMRGLWRTAAAIRIFCRMPLEYDESV